MSRLDDILALPTVTHNLHQGAPEWDDFRLGHRGASEAAAMLGLSRKVKRSELLRAKHTGIAREFSEWLQTNVLDHGHEVEALARPLVEADLGDDLYPVTCSRGLISASCDGMDMASAFVMEHKQWNEDLATLVSAGVVPDEHMPQCQQILLVTGAQRVRFVVSDGTRERMVWTDVEPDRAWWERIVAGWEQFDRDLATYTLPTAAEPAPIGRAPEALPALRIELTGAVTASNLAEFKDVALGAIRSVNRELSTDRDFADADKAVKWCGDVEDRIKAAKEYALSQTTSIEALFRTLDEVSSEARQVRLDLEKLVKRRKEDRKGELVAATMAAYRTHLEGLAQRFEGRARMPAMPVDFGTVIRGLKSFDSMADKLDTALANAKIESHKVADQIDANLRALEELAPEHKHLFADLATLVLKPSDDFRAQVRDRVAAHKEKVRLEAEAAAEKERARVRAEEEARAAAKVRQEQEVTAREQMAREVAEALERRQREAAAAPTPAPSAAPVAAPVAANVVPMPTKAPAAPATPPSLKLGEIQRRIAPLSIDAAGLATLGYEPAAVERGAKLFHEHTYPHMLAAMVRHLEALQAKQAA